MNTLTKFANSMRYARGYIFGPKMKIDPSAECAPGLRTLSPLDSLKKWPFATHPDSLGFFDRRKLVKGEINV
jgi:hypothetical protein